MNTQTVNTLVQAINQLQTCILNMDMNKAGLKHNKSPKHCHNSFKTPQKPSNKSKTHTNNRSKNINLWIKNNKSIHRYTINYNIVNEID